MKINQILDKIDERQLFVPAFQREYVWKRQHAKDLISSLINEYHKNHAKNEKELLNKTDREA